jgi:hypothetical protein
MSTVTTNPSSPLTSTKRIPDEVFEAAEREAALARVQEAKLASLAEAEPPKVDKLDRLARQLAPFVALAAVVVWTTGLLLDHSDVGADLAFAIGAAVLVAGLSLIGMIKFATT